MRTDVVCFLEGVAGEVDRRQRRLDAVSVGVVAADEPWPLI